MRHLLAFSIFVVATIAHGQTLNEPASWYGIVAGVSREPNVVAMYGPGQFDDSYGHGGRRSYVLTDGSVVSFTFGVDKVVAEILWDAAAPGAKKGSIRAEPAGWYGGSPGMLAGVTRERAVEWYGRPPRSSMSGKTWTYRAYACKCDAAEARLTFKNNRVVHLELVAEFMDE